MTRKIKVSASILCADLSNLKDEIKKCEDAGVDGLHVDVMDGHFVPNITMGPVIVEALRPLTKLPIETHLMIEHPWLYIENFIDAGSDIVSIHAECYGRLRASSRGIGKFPKEVDRLYGDDIRKDIKRIKQHRKKAFVVVNPGTPLCIHDILADVDGVLLMSVNPGFAKQKFIPAVTAKIRELRADFKGDIEVDGGINAATAPEVVSAGANILATASYFFSSDKPRQAVKYLRNLSHTL